jgi:hypothetical protein
MVFDVSAAVGCQGAAAVTIQSCWSAALDPGVFDRAGRDLANTVEEMLQRRESREMRNVLRNARVAMPGYGCDCLSAVDGCRVCRRDQEAEYPIRVYR